MTNIGPNADRGGAGFAMFSSVAEGPDYRTQLIGGFYSIIQITNAT
jgi:hypothetical protein